MSRNPIQIVALQIVHVRHRFEFLGYKIKRGSQPMLLPASRINSGAKAGGLYAYPREKSVRRFKDRIRRLTRRRAPLTTAELVQQINPTVRGWGEHFKRVHVRLLFNQLIAGSYDASGHIDSGGGDAGGGVSYLRPSYTGS